MIYHALVRSIETNSGMGFLNVDQGHPAYVLGASGKESKEMGDSPGQNRLFKLLASFDREFHEHIEDLSTWQKFCTLAVNAYNDATKPNPPQTPSQNSGSPIRGFNCLIAPRQYGLIAIPRGVPYVIRGLRNNE